MKAKVVVMLLAVMATLLVINPVPSYAGWHGRGSHNNGWVVGGAFVGGAVLGTVLGSALYAPRYVAVPAPALAYPAPAYAYPEPAYASEVPPGQWVIIPGQWISGRWVPPHRAWVPANPY